MSGDPGVSPYLYNANQAYLWYCSSDVYSGSRAADNQTYNWHFQGKTIIRALILHLLSKQNPPMTQATQVLLTGFSAGGMGTYVNVDFVGELVAAAVPSAKYRGYVDSGWFLDFPPFNPGPGPSDEAMALYRNWNSIWNEKCTTAYKPSGEEWRCVFPQYSYPFVTTPTYFAQHQYDSPFLGVGYPFSNNQTAEYGKVVSEYFLMVSSRVPALFSPNCYAHGIESYDARFNVISINGITDAEALWRWLQLSSPSRNIDACTPVNCNKACA